MALTSYFLSLKGFETAMHDSASMSSALNSTPPKFVYELLSEDLKRDIIESVISMRTPFFLLKEDEIIFANQSWFKHGANIFSDSLTGISLEQVMYNEVERVIGSKIDTTAKEKIAKDFESAIRSGQNYEFGVQSGQLMRGEYTEHSRRVISGVEFDISELREKRRDSRKAQKILQSTLDGIPHGVLLYDREGHVSYINKALQILAREMGMDLQTGMFHLDLRNQLPQALKKILEQRDELTDYQTVHQGENGRTYMLENLELKGVGYLFTAVDVTDLQKAIEAAKKADEAKSQFLANMSHEIRTPMNGVLGMTEILESMNVDHDQRHCINVIKSSAEALLGIINDILDYSKLDVNKIELSLEGFDVKEIIQEAIDVVRPIAAAKNIDILFDQDQFQSGKHMGDPGRIRQIVLNLLSNSLKFTKAGFVKISLTSTSINTDDEISIAVVDTGVGIKAEHLDTIFNSFEQSDNSMTREHGGTGLGLAISKKLVELMGGTIMAQSDLGKGSTFTMSVALARISHDIAKPKKLVSNDKFRNTPILIIGASAESRAEINEQLSPIGVRPYFVKNAVMGQVLLQKARSRHLEIPLIICNDYSPNKAALGFVRELRAQTGGSNYKIIILSPSLTQAENLELAEYDVDILLEKPFSNSALLTAVKSALPTLATKCPTDEAENSPFIPAKNLAHG